MTIQEFLAHFSNGNSIPHPKENREIELDYEWLPSTTEEFYSIVENAPYYILKGLGFRKFAPLNLIISENRSRHNLGSIDLPVIIADSYEDFQNKLLNFMATGESLNKVTLEFDDSKLPIDLVSDEKDIILFPREWYNLIPEGFELTCITGEREIFEKEKFSDEARSGCLAFGFLRTAEFDQNEKYLYHELKEQND